MELSLSHTEENYLKALVKLVLNNENREAGTNELASHMDVKPATANDMLKKLKEKGLVSYEKYGKINLTDVGHKIALDIIRKHRLWETFLYKKLEFTWDEVHDIAEQLEHIQSDKLIDKLEQFLEYPEFDPHGDPIPTKNGEFKVQNKTTLANVVMGNSCKMIAVKDNTSPFLKYLMKVGLNIHDEIKVLSVQEYDAMMLVEINGKQLMVSQKFAENIFVR